MGNILNIIKSDKEFYELDNQVYMQSGYGAFISDEIRKYFKVNLVDFKDTNEKEKYIYLIETRDSQGVTSAIHNIPNNIIDMVNKNNCKIIISYESEGNLDIIEFNKFFYNSCVLLGKKLNFKNVYVFTGDITCAEKNKTPINFFGSPHCLDSIAYDFNSAKNRNDKLELSEFKYDFNVKTIDDIDIDNKSKYFLCYLRNCNRLHRKGLAAYFQYHDLWDTNNISWLKVSWSSELPEYVPEKYWKSFFELDEKPLLELDTHDLKNKSGFNTAFSSDWKHNQESFLTIVSETQYEIDTTYISEKMVKPIMNLQPFIVMSTPKFLQFLKDNGFKTFDGFINKSYDTQDNHEQRFEMIFNELDKFRSKSFDELKDWWREILPILEHNQNRLIEIGQQKTNKIKLLEKLYD